jgi:hypothetical protein
VACRYNPASSPARRTVSGASLATSISFFKLFFEISHLELVARLENLLGLLKTELTALEHAGIGTMTAIFNAIPFLDSMC